MGVTVVVGGQLGSEGKGKVAQYWASQGRASAVVRVGGSNSGHTGYDRNGSRVVLRQLPTAALLPNVLCVLGAGSYIDVDLLLREIAVSGIEPERLSIDERAAI